MNKYYCVIKGRAPGIYDVWGGPDGAQAQVSGFSKAKHKSFYSKVEAEAWFAEHADEISNEEINNPEILEAELLDTLKTAGRELVYCLPVQPVSKIIPSATAIVTEVDDQLQLANLQNEAATSIHQLEMTALLQGILYFGGNKDAVFCSTSGNVVRAFTENWFQMWEASGWKTARGTTLMNLELWQQLKAVKDYFQPQVILVRETKAFPSVLAAKRLVNNKLMHNYYALNNYEAPNA